MKITVTARTVGKSVGIVSTAQFVTKWMVDVTRAVVQAGRQKPALSHVSSQILAVSSSPRPWIAVIIIFA